MMVTKYVIMEKYGKLSLNYIPVTHSYQEHCLKTPSLMASLNYNYMYHYLLYASIFHLIAID